MEVQFRASAEWITTCSDCGAQSYIHTFVTKGSSVYGTICDRCVTSEMLGTARGYMYRECAGGGFIEYYRGQCPVGDFALEKL